MHDFIPFINFCRLMGGRKTIAPPFGAKNELRILVCQAQVTFSLFIRWLAAENCIYCQN